MRSRFSPSGFKTAGIALLFLSALGSPAPAQTVPDAQGPRVYRTTDSRVAIGRSIHIASDEEVSDAVVVIGGSLRVDGRVRGDVVVVGGTIQLGPQSEVRGDVVSVGGGVIRAPGARLRGSVSDVSIGNWTDWSFGGLWWPTINVGAFGGFGRWLGLLSAVFRISLLALMIAFVLLVARAPVARVGRAAGQEPGRAFLLGLVAEILFLPALIVASIGLIVTIVGIPLAVVLVPFACFVAFVAMMLGFTAMACRIGEWVEDRLGWRGNNAFLASAIGLLLIVMPTMLARLVGLAPTPLQFAAFGLLVSGIVLEFVIWTIGVGATLMTGFGRWSTVPPPVPPVSHTGVVTVAG